MSDEEGRSSKETIYLLALASFFAALGAGAAAGALDSLSSTVRLKTSLSAVESTRSHTKKATRSNWK